MTSIRMFIRGIKIACKVDVSGILNCRQTSRTFSKMSYISGVSIHVPVLSTFAPLQNKSVFLHKSEYFKNFQLTMFKFGFSQDQSDEDEEKNRQVANLNWFPAVEIQISDKQMLQDFEHDENVTTTTIHDVELKLIRPESVVLNLKGSEHENIIKAESQHSDLLPAVYEGGLKIWECSYDLIRHLLTQSVPLEGKKVLDLGCGAGVVGITGLIKGSVVHFQDYNTEVIQLVTIPNVLLNLKDHKLVKEKAEFYSGDWAAFTDLSLQKYPNEEDKYDIILSSETIYNSENQQKLYEVFKRRLKPDGVGYVAAKTYYFGVGGGMRQFETLVVNDNLFAVEHVWRSTEGLQREIIKLVKRKS